MFAKLKIHLLLIALVLISACSQRPEAPKKALPWNIGITSPPLYPVSVSDAYGHYKKENFDAYIHNYIGPLGANDYPHMQKHNPNNKGFAVPLGIPVIMRGQIGGGIRELPDTLIINWGSWITNRDFITRLELSPALKKQMNTKRMFSSGHDGAPHRVCFQRSFVFGLLPDGRARFWLRGCGYYQYIKTLEPYQELTEKGQEYTRDDQQRDFLIKRRNDFGVKSFFPIPWQKINRIDPWSLQKKYEIQQPDYPGHPTDGTLEFNQSAKTP